MTPLTLFQKQVDLAESTIRRDGYLAPAFLVVTHDGKIIPLPLAEISAENKAEVWAWVANACIAFDAAVLLHVSEAWAKWSPTMQEALALRPAQSDQRIEVALVLCVYRDEATGERTCLQSAREIIRTAAGGVQGLAASLDDEVTSQFGGDLVSLLPAARPRRAERRRARQAFDRSAVGLQRKPSFDC